MAFLPQYMTSLRSWRDCYFLGILLAVELWSSRGRLRRQKHIDTPPTKSASYTANDMTESSKHKYKHSN